MPELEDPARLIEQEQALHKIILSKLQRCTLVQSEQQETVAYRLAEIFVAARQLYTVVMPRFLDASEQSPSETDRPRLEGGVTLDELEDEEDTVFELFGEVRMNLLHMRDLVEDFEESFLESLSGRLNEKEDEPAEGDDDEI